jgi:hypothetical protein
MLLLRQMWFAGSFSLWASSSSYERGYNITGEVRLNHAGLPRVHDISTLLLPITTLSGIATAHGTNFMDLDF